MDRGWMKEFEKGKDPKRFQHRKGVEHGCLRFLVARLTFFFGECGGVDDRRAGGKRGGLLLQWLAVTFSWQCAFLISRCIVETLSGI